jgi:nitrate/nitrite transport system ATP-binding protein
MMSSLDRRFLEVANLTKAYPNPYGAPVTVVKDFNVILRRGEVLALIGHSGCGKSTVLTMLAGLNEITSGAVVLNGREIDGPGPDRGIVFQTPCLLPWLTVLQNVQLGVDRVYPHGNKSERLQICEYYLNAVGLHESRNRYPKDLSGGMQQRVGIARAIAIKPRMLLLDEPFGRLDSLTRMELQDVVLSVLDEQRITTVMVTHDVDEAIYMSDRICMMTNGPSATAGQVITVPIQRPRRRNDVLAHPDYDSIRASMITFLEEQEARNQTVPRSRTTDVPHGRKQHASVADPVASFFCSRAL